VAIQSDTVGLSALRAHSDRRRSDPVEHTMYRIIAFAMCALLPSIDGLPGLTPRSSRHHARRLLTETSPLFRLGVVAGSLLFVLSPLITVGVPLPAFLLPRTLLDRHANRAASHRIYWVRQAMFLVKAAAALQWGADAEARRAVGMDPYPEQPDTWLGDGELPEGLLAAATPAGLLVEAGGPDPDQPTALGVAS